MPSWQAYSNIGRSFRCIGRFTVHGSVQVFGSSTVYSYSRVFASTRVNRSTRRIVVLEPRQLRSVSKLLVSTTRVSPSQRPTELPDHWASRSSVIASRPSMGMLRTVCTISVIITRWSGVWKICTFWL